MDEDGIPSDPLGARDNVVHPENLTRWNFTSLPMVEDESGQTTQDNASQTSPFPWRNDLNSKVILW